jgi:hypothetical protein
MEEDDMNIFTKMKLGLWFTFNKGKYLEYVDSLNNKLVIFNKFFRDNDKWNLTVITSTGEVLHHLSILEGKLEDTIHLFSQEMKSLYNGAFECDYDIVNIMPEDSQPPLFRKAADLFLAQKEREKKVASSSSCEEHWIFE